MALLKINNVSIKGLASAVPKKIEKISKLQCFAEGEGDKVSLVTGIKERRIAPEGMVCSDYCVIAAEKLLSALNWDPISIDLIIYVPLARDYNEPNTSNIIQHRLNISSDCIALDMPMACSGYVYGLASAATYLQNGNIKRALLFAGDTQSKMISPLDKTLWPINGDSASVTALEFDENAPTMSFLLKSDGSNYQALIAPASGVREYPTAESFNLKKISEGIIRSRSNIQMDGMAVFNFAIRQPYLTILELCQKESIDLEHIDYLILHQANKMIDEKIRKKLKLNEEKVPYSLEYFGNSSSGTIPLTMTTQLNNALNNQPLKLILCGFGAGLSWGAAYIHTDKIKVLPLIEI